MTSTDAPQTITVNLCVCGTAPTVSTTSIRGGDAFAVTCPWCVEPGFPFGQGATTNNAIEDWNHQIADFRDATDREGVAR